MKCAIAVLALVASAAHAAEEPPNDLRCGINTLYVGLRALDVEVASGPDELEQKLGTIPADGYSLAQLADVAESYGLHTLGVQTTPENLTRRPGRFVCIAHVQGSHFVNVANVQDGVVSIIDPPREYTMAADAFRTLWSGTALLISPDPLLPEEDLPQPFNWRPLLIAALAALAVWSLWIVLRSRRKHTNRPA